MSAKTKDQRHESMGWGEQSSAMARIHAQDSVVPKPRGQVEDVLSSIATIENKLRSHALAGNFGEVGGRNVLEGANSTRSTAASSPSLFSNYRVLQHSSKQAALEIKQELAIIDGLLAAVAIDLEQSNLFRPIGNSRILDTHTLQTKAREHKAALIRSIDKLQTELDIVKAERNQALQEVQQLKEEAEQAAESNAETGSRVEETFNKMSAFKEKVLISLSNEPQRQIFELQTKVDELEAQLVVSIDSENRLNRENDLLRDTVEKLMQNQPIRVEDNTKLHALEKAWDQRERSFTESRVELLKKIQSLENNVKSKDSQLKIQRDMQRQIVRLEEELERKHASLETALRQSQPTFGDHRPSLGHGSAEVSVMDSSQDPLAVRREKRMSNGHSNPAESMFQPKGRGSESIDHLQSVLETWTRHTSTPAADTWKGISKDISRVTYISHESSDIISIPGHRHENQSGISFWGDLEMEENYEIDGDGPGQEFNMCIAGLSALDTATLNHQQHEGQWYSPGGSTYRNM